MIEIFAFVGFCTCCFFAYVIYMQQIGNDRKAYKEEKSRARQRIAELEYELRMTTEDFDGFEVPLLSKSYRERNKAEIDEIKKKYNIK